MPQPRGQAVAEALAARGHQVLQLPFVSVEALTGEAQVAGVLADLAGFDRVVFVSPAAVDVVLEALAGRWPASVAPAVVGPGSREALARHGLDAHPELLMPPGPVFDAAALLAMPALAAPLAERVLIVRARDGNRRIEDELSRRGAQVHALDAYRRCELAPQDATLAALAGWLEGAGGGDRDSIEGRGGSGGWASARDRIDVWPQLVVTTVDAGQRLAALADGDARLKRLRACRVVTMHPRIAASMHERGWSQLALAAPGLGSLLAAIESDHRAAEGAPHRSGTERD